MRKIYFLFFFIPIFSFSQKKEGQARIDSLLIELPKMKEDTLKVNLLIDLSKEFTKIKTSDALLHAQSALELTKKIKWNNGLPKVYFILGKVYFRKLNHQKAIYYFNIVLKTTKNKHLLSKTYNELGLTLGHTKNYTVALENCNKSLSIAEDIKDNIQIGSCFSHLGKIYLYLNKFDKSINYFQKAIKINRLEKINISSNLDNIAFCYLGLNNRKFAEKYFIEALQEVEKTDNKIDKTLILGDLVTFYFEEKNYEKTLFYNEKLIEIAKNFENKDYTLCGDISADVFLEQGKEEKNLFKKKDYLNKANSIFNERLNVAKRLNDKSTINEILLKISEVQNLQGNYKEALESYKISTIYKDSIFNSDNKETIKNLEDKREIELRDKEIKINKLAIEAQQKQKWFYILGIGSLAILGGLLFYQSRNRKKNNQKLQVLNSELVQANKIKTRFFSILNHDLRSPVSNLIHFLHLQQNNPELLDEETKTKMQTKTITGAENLLSSMEDILLWSKGQMDNFKPQPKKIAINQLFDDTKKVFSGYLNIKFEYQNPDKLEIFTDENYMKTIIRNLTSNAINVLAKFVTSSAVERQIIWKAYKENNKTYLSITDNGSGASKDNFKALYDDTEVVGIKTGLGLHLIRDLAKAINCEIKVESFINKGTTITLSLNN